MGRVLGGGRWTAVTARLHVMCPGPGNTSFIYSRLATSLRSLAIILLYLPLYYSTILTSTCATVSTDIPSYEAIHRRMPLQRRAWCLDSIHQLVNSQPWECDKVTVLSRSHRELADGGRSCREARRKLTQHSGVN